MTDAQKLALEWLPKDGAWRVSPGRLSAALGSLSMYHSGCVKMEWAPCGPRGGMLQRWRLTDAGIAALVVNAGHVTI